MSDQKPREFYLEWKPFQDMEIWHVEGDPSQEQYARILVREVLPSEPSETFIYSDAQHELIEKDRDKWRGIAAHQGKMLKVAEKHIIELKHVENNCGGHSDEQDQWLEDYQKALSEYEKECK